MSIYTTLKGLIESFLLPDNDNNEISAEANREAIFGTIDALGEHRTYAGIVTPTSSAPISEGNIFCIAGEVGTYSNFGGYVHEDEGLIIFTNEGAVWSAEVLDLNYATNDLIELILTNQLTFAHTQRVFTSDIDFTSPDGTGRPIYYQYSSTYPMTTDTTFTGSEVGIAGSKYVVRFVTFAGVENIDFEDILVLENDFDKYGQSGYVYEATFELNSENRCTCRIILQEADTKALGFCQLYTDNEPLYAPEGVTVSPSGYEFDSGVEHPGFAYENGSLIKTTEGDHYTYLSSDFSVSCDTDLTELLATISVEGQPLDSTRAKITLDSQGLTEFSHSGTISTLVKLSEGDAIDFEVQSNKDTNLTFTHAGFTAFFIGETGLASDAVDVLGEVKTELKSSQMVSDLVLDISASVELMENGRQLITLTEDTELNISSITNLEGGFCELQFLASTFVLSLAAGALSDKFSGDAIETGKRNDLVIVWNDAIDENDSSLETRLRSVQNTVLEAY